MECVGGGEVCDGFTGTAGNDVDVDVDVDDWCGPVGTGAGVVGAGAGAVGGGG